MRIVRAEIGSFGRLRNRALDLSPGLNVVYGPNESGKTTMMEFMRSVLVPTNERKLYPERMKHDNGSLTVDDNGSEKVIELSGRKRTGDVPECLDIDPRLYRSIFAMSASDLDDSDRLNSGEVRTGFLAVPGGEGMPDTMDTLSKGLASVVGKASSSQCELNRIDADIAEVEGIVSELRVRAESYGDVKRGLDTLMARRSEAEGAHEAGSEGRRIANAYSSNAENYANLRAAAEERSGLGIFTPVSEEHVRREAALHADVESRAGAEIAAKEALDACRSSLGGANPNGILGRAAQIERLPGRLETYERNLSEIRERKEAPNDPDAPGTVATGPRGVNVLSIVGAIIAVASLVACTSTAYAVLGVASGIVLAIYGIRSGRRPRGPEQSADGGRTGHVANDGRAAHTSELEDYNRAFSEEVTGLMSALGQKQTDLRSDVASLTSLKRAAEGYGKADRAFIDARMARLDAENAYKGFLMGFGGKESFDRSRHLTRKAEELDSRIATLRGAIASSGIDPDSPDCPVSNDDSGYADEISKISLEIGRLEGELKSILDTKELDSLIDRRASLESERADILSRGAVLQLALAIAEEACDDIYGTVKPGVISTADRYLGMMTGGIYRIDTDPRNKDITVVSEDGSKSERAWSSGLRAQVMLSMKLALAKEMCGGEVPVILDDVLLTFDSERKRGAIEALSEVSGEMQILMFTCDAEARDLAGATEGAVPIRIRNHFQTPLLDRV